MIKQLVEENRFRIQEGNSNIVTNTSTDIKNTYCVTNLSNNHFNNGRLTIEKEYNCEVRIGNSNEKYSIVHIVSERVFTLEMLLDTNPNPIIFSTSIFAYRNSKDKIIKLSVFANPSYDIELHYLLINDYHNTIVESL